MPAKILIVGCGDLGTQIAVSLQSQGNEVTGVRISNQALPTGIHTIQADVTCPETLTKLAQIKPDYLVYCVAASAITNTDVDESYRLHYVEGLRHVLASQQTNSNLKHIFFVSSTRVYGQKTEDILDDLMVAVPADDGGRRLLEAEDLLRNLPYATTALRLSGIYGPGRTRMLRLAVQPELWPAYDSWSNRIHRDDAAAFIVFLISQRQQHKSIADCYIVTDSQPTTQYETLKWIAAKKNLPVNSDTPALSGGKRLSNKRMLESGYILQYPNYQAGYSALMAK